MKIEFNRKEEVKHKEECIQKLDEKAVLLNLKKEDEQLKENKDDTNSSQLTAANISSFTSLALYIGETNNIMMGLPPAEEKNEK